MHFENTKCKSFLGDAPLLHTKLIYLYILTQKRTWNLGFLAHNSIYFPSKQQTHLKNTQDGGDATKSKSLKDVAPPLQLKKQQNKANIKQRQAKHLMSMYME